MPTGACWALGAGGRKVLVSGKTDYAEAVDGTEYPAHAAAMSRDIAGAVRRINVAR